MEHYWIIARSVTYAQRMQHSLERAGVRCRISRAPREMTDQGCAYVVRVAAPDLSRALLAIHRERLDPVQIFLYHDGLYREVGL